MKRLLKILLISFFCSSAFAQPAVQSDVQQIRALLSATFDKPDAKVLADPVVVSGAHAIAGWTQGDMGGRALLRKENTKWSLIACAGDGLKEAKTLESAGIPKGSAQALVRQLIAAEAKVPEQRRKRFSLFGPMVDASTAHTPIATHPH